MDVMIICIDYSLKSVSVYTTIYTDYSACALFLYRVVEQTRSTLERDLLTETGSTTITYDMKMGVKGKGKLDVRLQFTDAEPKIVQVKKNESKVLILDVMCLNR